MAVEEDDDDAADVVESKHSGYNVLGTELSCCCSNVGGSGIGTGFYRNGFCGKYVVYLLRRMYHQDQIVIQLISV